MTDHARRSGQQHSSPEEPEAVSSVEAYETDDGVVFYDAENPLAWMESTRTYSLEDSV